MELPVSRTRPREATFSGPSTAVLGGLGGLAFVAIVVVQNVIRFAIAPANDAGAATIIDHLNDNRLLYSGLGASFAVSGVALALFVAAAWNRLAGTQRTWVQVGVIGAAGIMALFAAMVACEFALLALAGISTPSADAVTATWALHNGLFQVLDTFIAIGVLGFALAAARAGMTSPVFARLGPVAAALLLAGTIAGAPLTAGDMQPLMALSGIGFLGWLATVVAISVSLMREPGID